MSWKYRFQGGVPPYLAELSWFLCCHAAFIKPLWNPALFFVGCSWCQQLWTIWQSSMRILSNSILTALPQKQSKCPACSVNCNLCLGKGALLLCRSNYSLTYFKSSYSFYNSTDPVPMLSSHLVLDTELVSEKPLPLWVLATYCDTLWTLMMVTVIITLLSATNESAWISYCCHGSG